MKSDPVRTWNMLRAYVTQETVHPLRGAVRWLGVGLGAAVVVGIGCCFLLLAALRATQDVLARLDVHPAWGVASYAVTIVVGVVFVAVALGRIGKGTLS